MVYIDVVILINFIFDFTLLNIVDLLLKRKAKVKRIILGAIIGETSLLTLLISFNSMGNLLFKVILSIIMCVVSFGYKDKLYTLYNTIYLYLSGIILGGFMTYLYNEFKINREYSYRYIFLLIIGLMFLYLYYKGIIRFKSNYRDRYSVKIDYGESHYEGIGFLDSGNKLVSPYSGKPIILVEKEYISLHKLKIIPVPFNALNHQGILKCFNPDKVFIDEKEYSGVLIGISERSFNIDGCSVLLNVLLEGI